MCFGVFCGCSLADATAEVKASSGVSRVFVHLSSTCRTTSRVGGVLLKERRRGKKGSLAKLGAERKTSPAAAESESRLNGRSIGAFRDPDAFNDVINIRYWLILVFVRWSKAPAAGRN